MPEKNNTMKILISTAVLLILAAVFISSIADQTAVNTQRTNVLNESHNLADCVTLSASGGWNVSSSCTITPTYAPTGWKQEDCQLESIVVYNGTGTAVTLTTDYTVTATTGVIQLIDTSALVNLTGNNTYIDYDYCADNYVSSSWGRSVLGVNVGLYAVAILIAAALVVYLLFGKKEFDD